jgi:hypothetical protein
VGGVVALASCRLGADRFGDQQRKARRTEVQRPMFGHEEYARFLGFVKRHLKRGQVYHLSLVDLDQLEITPKGRYV